MLTCEVCGRSAVGLHNVKGVLVQLCALDAKKLDGVPVAASKDNCHRDRCGMFGKCCNTRGE